jgi:uncharacterized protein YcfJ
VARRVPSEKEMHQEADSLTGGPGVVATKSQAKGGVAGVIAGAVVGALVGLLVGVVFLEGAGVIITTVAFAVAGATAGGVAGGFVAPRRRLGPTEADR